MTVYVDQPATWNPKFKDYCHMLADSVDELHAMAAKLGLKKEWFQDKLDHPHYDIALSKRKLALELGAVEISASDAAKWIQRNRNARLKSPPENLTR